MNPLSHFSRFESNDLLRSDRFEGTNRIIQPQHAELTFTHPIVGRFRGGPSDFAGPIKFRANSTACNVYCMYSVTKPVASEPVDTRNFGFGDSFVLVLNTQAFVDRFFRAVNAYGLAGRGALVEYYEATQFSGATGTFRKPSTFAYQNEFRFAVWPGSGRVMELYVGSLVDITSEILPLFDVNHLVDFSADTLREFGLSM